MPEKEEEIQTSSGTGTVNGKGLKAHDEEKRKEERRKEREGGTTERTTTVRKRSLTAKQRCLEHYGHKCYVCNVDYGKKYGGRGAACIHVHHLVPISSKPGEHEIDPIEDLRPVCWNCHVLLHRDHDLSMDSLRAIVLSAA
jgi:5-methylcytosine-specific restriction protein A